MAEKPAQVSIIGVWLSPAHRWRGSTERLLLPALFATALGLRLYHIELTRFFDDQVDLLRALDSFLSYPHIPLTTGLSFSIGVRHPPLVLFLLALPALLSRSPVWLSAFAGLLDALVSPLTYLVARQMDVRRSTAVLAALLYAINPAAIVYGRMIWNPSFVPVFAAIGLLGISVFASRGAPLWLGLSLLALGCAAELHPVAGVYLGLWLVVALLGRRRLKMWLLVTAAGLLALFTSPYLYLQAVSGWADLQVLWKYAVTPKTIDLTSLNVVGRMIGPATYGELLGQGGTALRGLPYDFATDGMVAFVCVGLLVAARRWLPFGLIGLWATLPVAAGLRHSDLVLPQYFLAALPALVILQAIGVDAFCQGGAQAFRVLSRPAARHVLQAASGLAILACLTFAYVRFQGTVPSANGATEYGAPLRSSQLAAAEVKSELHGQTAYFAVPDSHAEVIPFLANLGQYQWNAGQNVFFIPPKAALYTAQDGTFASRFLSTEFGPPIARPSTQAPRQFQLFAVPSGALERIEATPGFTSESSTFDNAVQLTALAAPKLGAGTQSTVTMVWRIVDASRMPIHLSQFVHLVDGAGTTWSNDPDLWDLREPWRTGDVVVSQFQLNVPQSARLGGYYLETGFYDTFSGRPLLTTSGNTALRLGPMRVAGDVTLQTPNAPVAAFGGVIELTRANWSGRQLFVTWKSLAQATANYTVFVHVVDHNGKEIGQYDGPPGGSSFPTSLWLPGDVVQEMYQIPVAQQPELRLEIGLYTMPDFHRLPVRAGTAGGGDSVTMGGIDSTRND